MKVKKLNLSTNPNKVETFLCENCCEEVTCKPWNLVGFKICEDCAIEANQRLGVAIRQTVDAACGYPLNKGEK